MKTLTQAEYLATMGTPMKRREPDAAAPFAFWGYFDALPVDEYGGHDFSEGEVDCVYLAPSGRHEHVLVRCAEPNVFLVLVLDLDGRDVYGHRVLDLNAEYGMVR